MKSWYIYLAVIVSGASVLGIEILGTRLIGPFYGVSLYLWSALIGVTLAALSVGYAVGGNWADRGPRIGRLSLLLGIAGVWIGAIPWLRHPILASAEPLGLRTAVLVTATILFFPPLTLLGMVSPYAIRLKVSSVDTVGRTAGNLYAVSTVASVAAALVTGFFLIPNVGVGRLTFFIGILLIVTSMMGLATRRRGVVSAVLLLAPLVLGSAAFRYAPGQYADVDRGLMAVAQSPYAEIRVIDKNDLRFMVIDGGTHTIVEPETWASHFPYVHALGVAKRFFDEPGRMLLVGLGGGSVAKSFAHDGWRVDAVEIDPVVERFARDYFGLEPSDATIHTMDGRRFLVQQRDSYDVIIMDAFGSSSIPFHLVTRESFELIRSRLAPGGVFAMNVEAVGWNDILVRSLAATLGTVFANVSVLPVAEPPDAIGNLILMAADRSIDLDAAHEPEIPASRMRQEYHAFHAWNNRFEPDTAGAPVLTDDLNPVALWAERINRVARANLHQYFGARGQSW
jgi:spermidine synthase